MLQNDHANGSVKRLRADPHAGGRRIDPWLFERGHSGRRFVMIAGLLILSVWGGLYLLFRDWRTRHLARAAEGALFAERTIVPMLDRLVGLKPNQIAREDWLDAVAGTAAMLKTVAGSGQYDTRQIHALRDDVAGRVEKAKPDTILADLIELWDQMQQGGQPSISGLTRPKVLEPIALLFKPLVDLRPPKVENNTWLTGLSRVAGKVEHLLMPAVLDPKSRQEFRLYVASEIVRACAKPKQAAAVLEEIERQADARLKQAGEAPRRRE